MPPYAPERGSGSTLFSNIVNSTQIANTTTETIVVPDYIFPAGFFQVGTTVRGTIKGVCSNVVTTPGTLTHRIRMGATTGSATAAVASAALGLDTTAQTGAPWSMQFTLQCRTAGAAGTVWMTGQVWQFNVLASTAANLLPVFIPATGVAVQNCDTTIANFLSVTAQFSVNTAGTNITAQTYILESITV